VPRPGEYSLTSRESLLVASDAFYRALENKTTGELFLLLGANGKKDLCHQHGWNDEAKQRLPSAVQTSYADGATTAAAKEYAEEALAVLGDYETMLAALQSAVEVPSAGSERYAVQVMDQGGVNVAAFLTFAGELGAHSRRSVCSRFARLRQNPHLRRCEKEISFLVWAPLNGLATTFSESGDHRRVEVETDDAAAAAGSAERSKLRVRGWLCGHLTEMFRGDVPDAESGPGTEFFVRLCREGFPAHETFPLAPFTRL
jgi:hypothetical protein